MPSTNKIYLQT